MEGGRGTMLIMIYTTKRPLLFWGILPIRRSLMWKTYANNNFVYNMHFHNFPNLLEQPIIASKDKKKIIFSYQRMSFGVFSLREQKLLKWIICTTDYINYYHHSLHYIVKRGCILWNEASNRPRGNLRVN